VIWSGPTGSQGSSTAEQASAYGTKNWSAVLTPGQRAGQTHLEPGPCSTSVHEARHVTEAKRQSSTCRPLCQRNFDSSKRSTRDGTLMYLHPRRHPGSGHECARSKRALEGSQVGASFGPKTARVDPRLTPAKIGPFHARATSHKRRPFGLSRARARLTLRSCETGEFRSWPGQSHLRLVSAADPIQRVRAYRIYLEMFLADSETTSRSFIDRLKSRRVRRRRSGTFWRRKKKKRPLEATARFHFRGP